ncbi:MAG: methionyl-tRNA formyltransferase [Acidobacteriota bacterium]
MKLIFFGSDNISVPFFHILIHKGYKIELLITQTGKKAGRHLKEVQPLVKEIADSFNIPVHQTEKLKEDEFAYNLIRKIDPDLGAIASFGQIVPKRIIDLPKKGIINLHLSLLPKYRGAAPVQWAIIKGEKKTGVTVFFINENLDEGDIILQQEIEIHESENAYQLENHLIEVGKKLLIDAIDKIEKGIFTTIKQNHSEATYAPKLKKEDGNLNWNLTSIEIDRYVRALIEWPGTYTYFRKKMLKISRGIPEKIVFNNSPGTISKIDKNGIYVSCGLNTTYILTEVQLEGKKKIDAYSFSLGARITPGEVFSQSL